MEEFPYTKLRRIIKLINIFFHLPLVEAAIEHNVFGEDERGGLLLEDPELERNALQELAYEGQS